MHVQPGGGNRARVLDLRWDVDRNGTRSGYSVPDNRLQHRIDNIHYPIFKAVFYEMEE